MIKTHRLFSKLLSINSLYMSLNLPSVPEKERYKEFIIIDLCLILLHFTNLFV
jgi:hypothetical protein